MSLLAESAIYLLAAIISVPISKRLGFGSVLGYLAAGIIIGPFGLRLIRDPEHILHFAAWYSASAPNRFSLAPLPSPASACYSEWAIQHRLLLD